MKLKGLSSSSQKSDYSLEAWTLFFVSLAVFLGISLWSYHPDDPSWSSFRFSPKVHNWGGIVGSFLADLQFRLFGWMAWLVPLSCVWYGSEKLLRQRNSTPATLRWLWAFSLLLSLSALLQLQSLVKFSTTAFEPGGLIGKGLSSAFVTLFNKRGALLWLGLLAAVSFVLFFQVPLISFLTQSTKKIASFLTRLGHWGLSWLLSKFQTLWEEHRNSVDLRPNKTQATTSVEGAITQEAKSPPVPPIPHNDPSTHDIKGLELSVEEDFEPPKPKRPTPKFIPKAQKKIGSWQLPHVDLLSDVSNNKQKVDTQEIKDRARILTEKLSLFGVRGEVTAAHTGPAVTLYEFKPDSSVKISKITELADDLAMALSSESLRIIAPIPGRDVVGIETANKKRETVFLKDLLQERKFWSEDIKLPVALGKTVDGQSEIVDLRKMPHLIVAGTTGSGKSVFTVSLITGLIFRHSPQSLRLILVDPKQVDLAVFEQLPHLALPLVTDARQAVVTLKWAVSEMEKRYRSMSLFGARGLEAYNEVVSNLSEEQKKEHQQNNFDYENTPGQRDKQYYYEPLPYLVIVVEEFADLMSVDKGGVEQCVIRLAQKARACGIHLILCLQSPRKEFVTGAIKSNIPGRIAFKTASSMESRIILDETGAERLLASGDMLYRGPGSSHVIRHHGPFLKDEDIRQVTQFWTHQGEPQYLTQMDISSGDDSGDGSVSGSNAWMDEDDKFQEVIHWLREQKEVSASLIQRRFSIGYPRAARFIEMFEERGWVGPAQGSKPRLVLMNRDQ